MLDYVANGSNSAHDQSSLFAGSDPDVEEITSEVQQPQNHRRAFTVGPRALPSPTRASTFGRSQIDPQVPAFNSSRFHANGVFASFQEYDNEQDRSVNEILPVNGNTEISPTRTSGLARTTNGVHPESLFRYDPLSPHGKANGRLVNAQQADQFRPVVNQNYNEALVSFEALSVDQPATDIIPFRRTSLNPSQLQREVPGLSGPLSTQSGVHASHLDNNFHVSIAPAQALASRLNPQAAPHYGGFQYTGRGQLPPLTNDYRSNLTSPYYSNAGTPPTGPQSIRSTPGSGVSSRTSHHEAFIFDRKYAGVDPYGFDQSMFSPNSIQAPMNPSFQYDIQVPGQPVRMNPLAHPYIGHGHAPMDNYASRPRMALREPEQAHIVRSPLLEDFRLNSKTNRRFELKDIYGYVVEFSGDQHGSRFIQQKLETANSDEKEQVFKEIQPNLLQLMTDVFGNYVIQKMFEHGNQTQKKILAHHMKGHVHHLSMQMYGCRVVQKAFEHVLTDQQASLVKELDGPNLQVLKVVKDQNGNHVVQKAIERIPGEHIQFIVDAHRGQMARMSTHQYGCRVVQRMLEHCQPQAKRMILDELLESILPLISDSYGNYVVQHIIENGYPEDRRQVVDIILQQLLTFSKHKFASNIVEKSIDCADEDQREHILHGLTAPDEHGDTPVLGLMRDQYGNYVLRKFLSLIFMHASTKPGTEKVFNQLQGARQHELRADMERNYPVLRQTSYGKQVIAIEKLLFGSNGPPPPLPAASTASSRSSTLPSTNASSTADSETPALQKAAIK